MARALVREFCSGHKGDVFLEVRESNLGAIAFYESMGADVLPDWRICRVTGDALTKLAG